MANTIPLLTGLLYPGLSNPYKVLWELVIKILVAVLICYIILKESY